jgi:tRNA threonylcarbamoyladenosine biosynthesis protein TsaB
MGIPLEITQDAETMSESLDIRQLRTSKKKKSAADERRRPVILACDTSTNTGSVAVVEGGVVTGEILISSQISHSLRILKDVKTLLAERDININDIDAFVSSAGPGSFTGVRIALSTMKGLAWSLKKPLITVGSLDVLVHPVLHRGMAVLAALDAKRQEVYAALFDESGHQIIPQAAVAPAELAAMTIELIGPDTTLLAVGEGIDAYHDLFAAAFGDRLVKVEDFNNYIKASVLGIMGNLKLAAGDFSDVETVEPVYLRRSEAEISLENRQKQSI